MEKFVRLMRLKHWIKNLFVFIPVFYHGNIFEADTVLKQMPAFLLFGMTASAVYILNDLKDREDDKKHPEKRKRPIASGEISPTAAALFAAFLVILTGVSAYFVSVKLALVLLIYFLMNILYSLQLKKFPIVDLAVISTGFILRLFAGSATAEIALSPWLLVTVFLLTFLLALNKRREEVHLNVTAKVLTRESVKGYTLQFIDSLTVVLVSAIIVVYMLYSISASGTRAGYLADYYYITSFWVVLGLAKYLQLIYANPEKTDPTNMIYRDKHLAIIVLIWFFSTLLILYWK